MITNKLFLDHGFLIVNVVCVVSIIALYIFVNWINKKS